MTEFTILDRIKDLRKVCKLLSMLKSQLIERLPHHGHDALFLKNDDITTGLLNNITEIKIHLLTGQLLYFENEKAHFVDLVNDDIREQLGRIVTTYDLDLPQIPDLRNLSTGDLSYYYAFATKV